MRNPVKSILVVDDDEFITRFLKEIFDFLKVPNLYEVADGVEALQLYNEVSGELDAIVVDLQMPNLDGLSFLRELAELHYTGSVVILSGLDRRILNSAVEIAKSHDLNLIGSLAKPLDPLQVEMVYQRIGRVKQKRRKRIPLMEWHSLFKVVKEKSVEPYFQPIVDCRSQAVYALESLMRIEVPGGEPHEAATFLPVAEENELMAPLTDSMLHKSLSRYRELLAEGYDFRLTINLSPVLLHDVEFPDQLEELLSQNGIRPERVMIEVTENSVMVADPSLLEVLSRLRIKGFDLALDDFGTGFSSICQLKELPFNVIKIDKCFIHGITHDEVAEMIVQSVLQLASELGFVAILEGVERREDLEMVLAMGGQYIQGYLLCRPIPYSALRTWLDQAGTPQKMLGCLSSNIHN